MHYEWITTLTGLIRELEANRIRIVNCRKYLDGLYKFHFDDRRRYLSENEKDELNRCFVWTYAGLRRLAENHFELQRLILEKNGEFDCESIDVIIGPGYNIKVIGRPQPSDIGPVQGTCEQN